jgi:lipopolysaccharide/colanic/teichoic acid biosynthesis glycosyltransferase
MTAFAKRFTDVTVAAILLVIASPALGVSALLVRIDSPGPAFYRGVRVGRGGRTFRIYKLRTMASGAEGTGPAITAGDDIRITRAGRVLRRMKLDELPQLVNVLKGEMSLVGPRPEHPDFVQLYDERQRMVLSVRPGITSAASVRFHDEEDLLRGADVEGDYVKRILPTKLDIDLSYVEHPSLAADVRILWQTAWLVLGRLKPRSRITATPRT